MDSLFSGSSGGLFLPLILILTLVSGTAVFAAGDGGLGVFDPKAELERAEELVAEGRLDEAIAHLIDIADRAPEQIERVQKLILDIRAEKSAIDALLAGLTSAIEAGDEAAVDQIIRSIKEIDTSPNRNTLNKLILASAVIGKSKNDEIRDDLFARGNELLASGDFREAVTVYRSGFESPAFLEFYDEYIDIARERTEIFRYLDDPDRQEKIWNAYGTIAPEGDEVIEALQLALDRWDSAAEELTAGIAPLAGSIETDTPDQWEGFIQPFATSMVGVVTEINDARGRAEELESLQNALYAALDGIPEDFRYERIGEFVGGRRGTESIEGITASQLRFNETALLNIAERLEERTRTLAEQGRREYLSGASASAGQSLAAAAASVDAAGAFGTLIADYISGEASTTEDFVTRTQEISAYQAAVRRAVPVWLELDALVQDLPNTEGIDFANLAVEEIDALADPVQELIGRISVLTGEWDRQSTALAELPAADYTESRNIDAYVRADLASASEQLGFLRLSLYMNTVTPIYEVLESEAAAAMNIDLAGLRQLIYGSELPEESQELPDRRPSAAMNNIVNPALAALEAAEDSVAEFLGVLDQVLNRRPPIANPEEAAAFGPRAENLLVGISEVREALRDLERGALAFTNTARRLEITAANALETAARDLAAAQAAVGRGEQTRTIDEFYRAINLYDAVDESLNTVDQLYLEVLINDVDIAENSGIEASRTAVRDRIQTDRSRLAVTVKQSAVSEARAAYDQGQYATGIVALNQSQEFWSTAYGEDDPEIGAWLTRLRNAQFALRQTVIEPTDPLYAEMNQYINLASRYYTSGRRTAEDDPRNADALRAFRAASDLLTQVLNTFPGNEAALLLEQRILRQTDAEAWSADAGSLLTETRRAINRRDVNGLLGNEIEKGLYSQVKVIREIEAGFPGLDALIYDAEVVLGIVIPPPDPAILAESRRITGEARQIWTNLGDSGSGRAIELLDNALVLWLDNEQASTLKNEILLSTEPERLPPLPPDLLNLINLVEEYYSQGNFILARAFLDRIAGEYFQFRTDPRIRDWNQKVDARL